MSLSKNPVIKAMQKALYSPTGVSQKELAEHLNISPQYLSDILRGNRFIPDKVANKLGFKKVIKWVKL